MGDYTKYLRLIKPGGNDYYNVDDFNQNSELIDKETEKLNNAVTKIQEGATREKAGIVQFGTEEGKALEGMMLARLAGCVGYGGDIQTAGVKDINYIYYDRNTRKMYKCLNQNSDVSANVANFIPLDNNSLLERLENLIKVKRSGDCNVVHNDCTIAFEPWSSTLLKNRPNNENNPAGILISFYHGRRVQLYISGDTMYTRVNQGAEDYNSWLQWVKCSN
nr:MAG TPA: hypothetical protein [Caudoviricetes sp.]